jgi:hypothetical protein
MPLNWQRRFYGRISAGRGLIPVAISSPVRFFLLGNVSVGVEVFNRVIYFVKRFGPEIVLVHQFISSIFFIFQDVLLLILEERPRLLENNFMSGLNLFRDSWLFFRRVDLFAVDRRLLDIVLILLVAADNAIFSMEFDYSVKFYPVENLI